MLKHEGHKVMNAALRKLALEAAQQGIEGPKASGKMRGVDPTEKDVVPRQPGPQAAQHGAQDRRMMGIANAHSDLCHGLPSIKQQLQEAALAHTFGN